MQNICCRVVPLKYKFCTVDEPREYYYECRICKSLYWDYNEPTKWNIPLLSNKHK